MIELTTPRGLPVAVPETLEESSSPRFAPDDHKGIVDYYAENGYVVVAGLLDGHKCDEARRLWEEEVKPSDRFLYRQATAKAEKHVKNAQGWIMNPILNLQSVDPDHYGEFREFAVNHLLTDSALVGVEKALLRDRPKIVQTMYFEGNSATWEHQDSYYLDSEVVGSMLGAWIALEPIEAHAGRFFVCPGSHKLEYAAHGGDNNVADHHEVFIASIVQKVRELGLEIRAPRLEKGDALFWNSLTIHGSLDSQDKLHSRSSITCHTIPASQKFLQLQLRLHDVPTDRVNGVDIYRPKDLSKDTNRAVFWMESRFPKQFYALKSQAIRVLAARSKESEIGGKAAQTG